jgi:hypothetical protein
VPAAAVCGPAGVRKLTANYARRRPITGSRDPGSIPGSSTICARALNSGQSEQRFCFSSHIIPSAFVHLCNALTSNNCSNPVSCHRFASELLTQTSREIRQHHDSSWHPPSTGGTHPGRRAQMEQEPPAPETPAVGRGQSGRSSPRRRPRTPRSPTCCDAGASTRCSWRASGPGQGRRARAAEEGPGAQSQGPGEGSLEGRGLAPRGRLQGSVDRDSSPAANATNMVSAQQARSHSLLDLFQ